MLERLFSRAISSRLTLSDKIEIETVNLWALFDLPMQFFRHCLDYADVRNGIIYRTEILIDENFSHRSNNAYTYIFNVHRRSAATRAKYFFARLRFRIDILSCFYRRSASTPGAFFPNAVM
ncbi:hypothetical protein PUN28_000970 [Cardiocondyla obscurior]|uniref:Uncharacterized protein n=1 Tax=Cardiocondyla obscurior TaxID=286306 RepID=A0AAW2H2A9_9HYME